MDVVLIAPEIATNTGNIIRLCANTGAALHLVEPLGFTLQDRLLRRAGLDYHEYAKVAVHSDLAACVAALHNTATGPRRWFALSSATWSCSAPNAAASPLRSSTNCPGRWRFAYRCGPTTAA